MKRVRLYRIRSEQLGYMRMYPEKGLRWGALSVSNVTKEKEDFWSSPMYNSTGSLDAEGDGVEFRNGRCTEVRFTNWSGSE